MGCLLNARCEVRFCTYLHNLCKPCCTRVAVSILQYAGVCDLLFRVEKHMWGDSFACSFGRRDWRDRACARQSSCECSRARRSSADKRTVRAMLRDIVSTTENYGLHLCRPFHVPDAMRWAPITGGIPFSQRVPWITLMRGLARRVPGAGVPSWFCCVWGSAGAGVTKAPLPLVASTVAPEAEGRCARAGWSGRTRK